MKKPLLLAAVASLFAAHAFATYYVVLKNGTQYKAKAKWTVSNGKALIALESGQSLLIDPALIDEPKSEQVTLSGTGGINTIDLNPNMPQTETQPKSSLGSAFKIRKLPGQGAETTQPSMPAPVVPSGKLLGAEVVDKFDRAYENVGIFEKRLVATGPNSLRAELTADSEDKVFNAISATSFLIMRNAGVSGARVDMVELFMKTTTGGSSGRFQMSRQDAQALDSKQISQQDYFLRKVIF
jgi:hypothetical protein